MCVCVCVCVCVCAVCSFYVFDCVVLCFQLCCLHVVYRAVFAFLNVLLLCELFLIFVFSIVLILPCRLSCFSGFDCIVFVFSIVLLFLCVCVCCRLSCFAFSVVLFCVFDCSAFVFYFVLVLCFRFCRFSVLYYAVLCTVIILNAK